jgi:hypothetical protein
MEGETGKLTAAVAPLFTGAREHRVQRCARGLAARLRIMREAHVLAVSDFWPELSSRRALGVSLPVHPTDEV